MSIGINVSIAHNYRLSNGVTKPFNARGGFIFKGPFGRFGCMEFLKLKCEMRNERFWKLYTDYTWLMKYQLNYIFLLPIYFKITKTHKNNFFKEKWLFFYFFKKWYQGMDHASPHPWGKLMFTFVDRSKKKNVVAVIPSQ